MTELPIIDSKEQAIFAYNSIIKAWNSRPTNLNVWTDKSSGLTYDKGKIAHVYNYPGLSDVLDLQISGPTNMLSGFKMNCVTKADENGIMKTFVEISGNRYFTIDEATTIPGARILSGNADIKYKIHEDGRVIKSINLNGGNLEVEETLPEDFLNRLTDTSELIVTEAMINHFLDGETDPSAYIELENPEKSKSKKAQLLVNRIIGLSKSLSHYNETESEEKTLVVPDTKIASFSEQAIKFFDIYHKYNKVQFEDKIEMQIFLKAWLRLENIYCIAMSNDEIKDSHISNAYRNIALEWEEFYRGNTRKSFSSDSIKGLIDRLKFIYEVCPYDEVNVSIRRGLDALIDLQNLGIEELLDEELR